MIDTIPGLVYFDTELEYRNYFKEKYCDRKVMTFDNIEVRFYEDNFDHAFFESTNWKHKNKDQFSLNRARRIDLIEYALSSTSVTLHVGWDRDAKSYNKSRRVALITPEDYVVVIKLINQKKAKFITAYYADNSASKIRNSPIWQ